MADKKWLYGLTSDEWFSLACLGQNSEVPPCCADLSWFREILWTFMTLQSIEDNFAMRQSVGRRILAFTEDGGGHDLLNSNEFPLLNRVLAGIRKEAKMSIFDVIDGEKL